MIIDCIGCLHGAQPKLKGGDLLIVTGDLTAADKAYQYVDFFLWLDKQKYRKKVVIAGNHDNVLQQIPAISESLPDDMSYLCDSGTEFEGLKIWGSPWTAQFPGINPDCCAFTCDYDCDPDQWLDEKWSLIPSDIDIVVTHTPLYGVRDKTILGDRVGSKSLQTHLFDRVRPRLHVFSHIHEAYGVDPPGGFLEKSVNCSIMNERYQPVNAPIRIILGCKNLPRCCRAFAILP